MSRRLAPLALVVPLLLSACAGADEAPEAQAPAPTSAAAAPTAAPTSAVPSPTQAVDDATVVSLTVTGGKVSGDTGRVPVEQGAKVRLVVTADVVDEVHLHGYDLHVDTAPGQAVQLEFVADQPGVFEAELEESKVVLTRLQVQ